MVAMQNMTKAVFGTFHDCLLLRCIRYSRQKEDLEMAQSEYRKSSHEHISWQLEFEDLVIVHEL